MELVKDFSMPVPFHRFPLLADEANKNCLRRRGASKVRKRKETFSKDKIGADNGPNEKECFQCQSHASRNVHEERKEEKRKQRTMCNYTLRCEFLTCKI